MLASGSRECELRVTLDDVLDATHSGKWFVVGAAWNGPKPSNGKKINIGYLQKHLTAQPSVNHCTYWKFGIFMKMYSIRQHRCDKNN